MKVRLGDYIQEYSVKNKYNEDFPVYSVTNKKGFCKDFFSKDVASKDKTTYKIVPRGCFAYNPSRINVGSVDWQRKEEKVIVSPLYNVFAVSPKLNQQYLYYYLKSKISLYYIKNVATGSVRDNLKLSMLYEFPINLPDIMEQQCIVKILDTVCSLILIYQQKLDQYDNLIKARFVEMFGTLQDNQYGYSIVTIEAVCSMIKDGTHQTPIYTENTETGYKFLSSKDVMTQKIDWTNIKYISSDLHEKLYATIKPQRNDILMSKNGVNYGVAAVNDTDEIFDIYVSLALLRPKEVINPVYLRCVINSPDTKRQFAKSIKGIGVPNLHLGEIRKTKILLPSLARQNQFAAFVHQVDKSKFLFWIYLLSIKLVADFQYKAYNILIDTCEITALCLQRRSLYGRTGFNSI